MYYLGRGPASQIASFLEDQGEKDLLLPKQSSQGN